MSALLTGALLICGAALGWLSTVTLLGERHPGADAAFERRRPWLLTLSLACLLLGGLLLRHLGVL